MSRGRLSRAMSGMLLLSVVACSPAPGPLTFDPAALPAASRGVAYDARINVLGNVTPVGGYTITFGALPAGLSIARVAGADAEAHIFGTPTTAEKVTFTVSAWCYGTNVSGQSGSTQYSITVR